jgi:hypothetical protein
MNHTTLSSVTSEAAAAGDDSSPGLGFCSPTPTGITAMVPYHLEMVVRYMLGDGSNEFFGGEILRKAI